MEKLTKDTKGIRITVYCEEEPTPIEGNASAIDAKTDADTAKWIRAQLRRGNDWAWCCVKVTVSYKDEISATDYLGCCSYKNEADFREPGGYFDDMVANCLDDLNAKRESLLADFGGAL